MSKPIVLTTRHKIGIAAVKQRLTERFEHLKRNVVIDRVGDARMDWQGDVAIVSAKALGQRVHATIAVAEHDTTVTVQLPALLSPFRGAIAAFIEKQEDAVKEKPSG